MKMSRRFQVVAAIAAFTVVSFVASAQPVAKTLPDAEAAEGWLKLFDGQSLFGWTVLGDAQWSVQDGVLVCDSGSGGWLATTSRFGDFELTAKVRAAADGAFGLSVRGNLDSHPSENGAVVIPIAPGGAADGWRTVRVVAEGPGATITVDGAETKAEARRPTGHVGILYYRQGKVEVAELKLRPLNMKPLFNGKDLTGWNIIPEHKSQFSVVDGALNIKDGNGQIETAETFKDFVLQLDIFSNGEHLNSGVFYRGPVGVFWKGYESQVRNQWEGDDRTKPEDYGTGGNYGNQPAREVVSSDKEWFHKTIVCSGNHAAVWINGYLVSDYLDMRPVSDDANGKRGYVPGPGTIHLQGHDPTTDLSFKNIRIQVYPERRAGGSRPVAAQPQQQ